MKEQVNSQKYTIAWFRLAEFVLNGKKQQALSILRLLSYSLPDEAIAQQLEGDLLWSFSDIKALTCYTKAAYLYEKQGKFLQALALYEHMLSIQPDSVDFALKFFKLSQTASNIVKQEKALAQLIELYEKNDKIQELLALVKDTKLSLDKISIVHERILQLMARDNRDITYYLDSYKQFIDNTLRFDERLMENCLNQVRDMHQTLYNAANSYIKGDSLELVLK